MDYGGDGVYLEVIFLDPLFWQSLGKAMGWECKECKDDGFTAEHDSPNRHGEDGECVNCPIQVQCESCRGGLDVKWKKEWHRFIDHLAEGKDAESFFESL
jgi:hypothetical protein